MTSHRSTQRPTSSAFVSRKEWIRRTSALVLCLTVAFTGCSESGVRVAEVGPSSDGSPAASSTPPSMDEMYPPEVRGEMSKSDSSAMEMGAEGEAPGTASREPADSSVASEPAGEELPPPRETKAEGGDAAESANLSKIQRGVLTAGSFDDHRRYGDFRDFLSRMMQNDPYERLPRVDIGSRVIVQLHNENGEPVANTRVDIAPADSQSQQASYSSKTGSDGRTLFMTHHDANGCSSDEFVVTVRPEQGQPVEHKVKASDGIWAIELKEASLQRPNKLDIALVIDATGSMGDEMDYLKIEIDHIASTVKKMFPNVDQRFALIAYRDRGDAFVTRTFDFTSSLPSFRQRLSQQTATGGGDYPEAMDAAMEAATQLSWRGGNAARVMFLIGDAPPHEANAQRALTAANSLRKQNVRVYPIAASGAAWQAEFVLRTTAFLTLGEYLFLTDHSGVGNPHAKPNVPEYQVEHLNRLMVRMIAQELAGKKLAPAEVIAIERGEQAPLRFQPIQQQQLSYYKCVEPTPVRCLPPTPEQPVVWAVVNWSAVKWVAYGLVICGAILIGALFNF